MDAHPLKSPTRISVLNTAVPNRFLDHIVDITVHSIRSLKLLESLIISFIALLRMIIEECELFRVEVCDLVDGNGLFVGMS